MSQLLRFTILTLTLTAAGEAFPAEKQADGTPYSNQFANECLKTLAKALVISSPNVEEQIAVPGSDLSFFYCNRSWDCHEDRPPQVTTMDRSILEKGATSAIVTPEGKVIQIMENGNCSLSQKKFESSYEFVARQMKNSKNWGEDMRRILGKNAEEKKMVAQRCGGITPWGRTAKLHEALLEAKLIAPKAPSAAPTGTPANQ